MRKIIAAPIVAGLIGMAALTAPLAAHAATAEVAPASTTATFDITGGDLTISSPRTSPDLGGYTAGANSRTISNQLGYVIVTDNRALVVGSWNATVTSTNFTTGTSPTADQTVPAGDITYTPGDTSGAVNTAETTYTAGTAHVLGTSTGLQAMGTIDESGVGGVSWNPTLDVALPAQVVAGSYSGTVTHSVA